MSNQKSISTDNGDLAKKIPGTISQGLKKLEEIIKLPSTPQLHKLQQQIIEEHILNFPNISNNQKKSINSIEEIVIVRCIAGYLADIYDAASRNSLFITLFPAVSSEVHSPLKVRILSSLVSLSVATHNVAVLDATAVWMQQVGCFSVRCCTVSYGLIQDFFQSNVDTPPHLLRALQSLPSATPLFTANLITSLAQVYAKIGTNELCGEPPPHLVEIIVHWLKSSPSLALTPLTTELQGVSLPMAAVLAIAPLSKWCVEAPFFQKIRSELPVEDDDIYAELHLLLLQTLQKVPSLRHKMTQSEVICGEHMKNLVDSVNERLRTSFDAQAKNTALNRLAQVILVALHTTCLSGRTGEMWNSLKTLPKTARLVKTLLTFSPC